MSATAAYKNFKIGRQYSIYGYYSFLVVSILLLAMSCDEIARIHERIQNYIPSFIDVPENRKKHAEWVWVGGPIILILFIIAIQILRRPLSLVPKTNLLLVLGFGSIFMGGVVFESSINWLNHDELQWVWNAEIFVEESLEFAGSLLILYGFTRWNQIMTEKHSSQ